MEQIIAAIYWQMEDIMKYLPKAFLWAFGIVLVLSFFLAGRYIWRKKTDVHIILRLPVLFFFIMYVYCVLQITILSRETGNYGGVDLRFMAKWDEWYGEKAFFLSNIIMFIPFGIFLPMLGKWTRHILISFPIAILSSTLIEYIQLKYQLGFCQLDDVVANSGGFLIGFLIYVMLYDGFLLLKKGCELLGKMK